LKLPKNIASARGEYEITDVNSILEKGALKVGILPEERLGWIQELLTV
jgi:dTDP-glucose pyrophosphorylase